MVTAGGKIVWVGRAISGLVPLVFVISALLKLKGGAEARDEHQCSGSEALYPHQRLARLGRLVTLREKGPHDEANPQRRRKRQGRRV